MQKAGIPDRKNGTVNMDRALFNFQVIDHNSYESEIELNLGTNIIESLNRNTKLNCFESWESGQIMDACINKK